MVEKVRYMISDAANLVHVESHVLRYWEEELGLVIPRNEMGHRYYTRENIQEFIKIRELKEQGYPLKSIRSLMNGEDDLLSEMPATTTSSTPSVHSSEERMEQFCELMNDIVGRAIALNNEELSQNIGKEVREYILKEINFIMREQDEAQEERYKKLDAAIRGNLKTKKKFFEKKKEKPLKKDRKLRLDPIHPAIS